MSLCEVHWKSEVLRKQLGAYVILPDVGRPPFATFYLLHGLSDDHTTWLRRTRVEWYVRELPLIVVMPDGGRGLYTNNAGGPPFANTSGRSWSGSSSGTSRPGRSGRPARSAGCRWAGTARCGWRSATRKRSPAPTATPASSSTTTPPPPSPAGPCCRKSTSGSSAPRRQARTRPGPPRPARPPGRRAAAAADRLRHRRLPAGGEPAVPRGSHAAWDSRTNTASSPAPTRGTTGTRTSPRRSRSTPRRWESGGHWDLSPSVRPAPFR